MIYNLAILLSRASEIYTGALVIYALLSWFPGGYESGVGRFLAKICDPYLSIFDRLNLNFGGISFSIMVAVFVLNIGTRAIIKLLFMFM